MGKKIIRLTEEQFQAMLTDMITEELIKEGGGLAKIAGAIGKMFSKSGGKSGKGGAFSQIKQGFTGSKDGNTGYSVWNHLKNAGKAIAGQSVIHDYSQGGKKWYEKMTPEQQEAMDNGGSSGVENGKRWIKNAEGNQVGDYIT